MKKRGILREIFVMIVPITLESSLSFLASLVTTAMVGRLTTQDIAAQGVANRIFHTMESLFSGLAVGVALAVSIYFAQKKRERCKHIVNQAFLTMGAASVLFLVLFSLIPRPLLGLVTDEAEALARAVPFLRILSLSVPFVAVTRVVASAFQGQGDTRTPMFIALFVNIVNLLLGWMFIFGNLGMPALGLPGAGIALVASKGSGALLGLWLLYGRRGPFRGIRCEKFTSLSGRDLSLIYRTGLPAAGEFVMWEIAAIVMSRIIFSYGEASYAAYNLGLQTEGIFEVLAVGFVNTSLILAARATATNDPGLYREYFKDLFKVAGALTAFTFSMMFFFPNQLMHILTDKEDLIAIGAHYVFAMSFAAIPQNVNKIFNGYLRTSGNNKAPLFNSCVGLWGARVGLSFLVAHVLHWPVVFIWWSIVADQTVRMLLGLIEFRKFRVLKMEEWISRQRVSD